MIRKLVVALPLVLTIACTHSNDSNTDASPQTDLGQACMNQVSPSTSGREMRGEEILSGKRVQWKLTGADLFQSLEGDGQTLYVGASAIPSDTGYSVSRLCGGGSANADGTFRMRFPEIIRSKDGIASSFVEVVLGVDTSSIHSREVKTSVGKSEKLNFKDKPGAKNKITKINDTTMEIWASFPSDEGKGKGQFVFRATYTAVQPTALDVYQEAYQFAFTSEGLNMYNNDARDFASGISAKGADAGGRYLDVYKSAYFFMFSSEGVNLYRNQAMPYADAIAASENPENTFETFKKAYLYAFGSNGLNLYRDQALKFAREQAHISVAGN